jgi:predicted nucleotidyltransferase
MKESLDHLPAKKRRQLTAVAELIRKEAEAEMVILFGSHARGDWIEDPAGS